MFTQFGDSIGIVTYTIGLFGWFYVWKFLDGYRLMREFKLLYLPFISALVTFTGNIFLSFFSIIPTHDIELNIYRYVEENAKATASLALAVAIFVVFTYRKADKLTPISRSFLWMILWSLLFAACGVLPLFWMPAKTGWLTVLRHLKSVPYFYSLFSLVAGLVVFVESMRRQDAK